jgi:hypothetical protein
MILSNYVREQQGIQSYGMKSFSESRFAYMDYYSNTRTTELRGRRANVPNFLFRIL